MAQTETAKGPAAAYVPYKTFRTAVATLRQSMPNKLDRSAWPSLSGAAQGEVFAAFRFLGLVNSDGVVQPILRELASNTEDSEGFKSIIAGLLKSRYPKVHEAAQNNATIAQLQEVMRGHGVAGSTLDKAIRFWTEAAKHSGVAYPPAWDKARGAMARSSRRRRGTTLPPHDGGDSGERYHNNGNKPPQFPSALNPVVAALINDLATKGDSWTQEERDMWKASFDTIFNYAYPAREGHPQSNS